MRGAGGSQDDSTVVGVSDGKGRVSALGWGWGAGRGRDGSGAYRGRRSGSPLEVLSLGRP